jgi:hypothetical protein
MVAMGSKLKAAQCFVLALQFSEVTALRNKHNSQLPLSGMQPLWEMKANPEEMK